MWADPRFKKAPAARHCMTIKIIGLIIGILVLGAGLYYRAQEKHDPESKKIYTVVSLVGLAVTAVCTVLLICG